MVSKKFFDELVAKRQTYRDMIDFCCDSLILNNAIVPELEKNGYYFDVYCGDYYTYEDEDGNEITRDEYEERLDNGLYANEICDDIYQYFIVNRADYLAEYTNELVLYNEDLDLYILCVKHFGTSWDYVSANWKDDYDGE